MTLNDIKSQAYRYFNLMPDKEDESEIKDLISSGVSFRGANLWILIFAIFIASLGLNVNSTAVIIGAMLISPLMGPIIGMGLAVGINDLGLLKRSFKNYAVATLISVLTATLYFLVTPLSEAQSELLARTSPTLYDVLIAFCGGAAGIIALCTRGKGNVIPGVAIATALMPPLCTAGFGLATGHILYFLGAFYLFFINTVFIALSTFGGVRLLQFQRHEFKSPETARKTRRLLTAIVLITMIPAAYMTVNIVSDSIIDNNVRKFVKQELTQPGTQIISNTLDRDARKLRIVAVGREINQAHRDEAQRHMALYSMDGYQLQVIQGTQSDSLLMLSNQLSSLTSDRKSEQQKLLQLSTQNNLLSQELQKYTQYRDKAADIRQEMATLFPQVQRYSLSPVTEYGTDSTYRQTFVAALIQLAPQTSLTTDQGTKLHDWLQTRIKADSLVIVIRH